MKETILKGEGQLIAEKEAGARASLYVKLERGAEITIPNVCGRRTDSEIDEGNTAAAGGKIVPKQWSNTDKVSGARVKLFAAEKLGYKFPITAIPMVGANRISENQTV